MNRIIKFRAWNSQQNLMVEDANWLVDKNIDAAILMQFTGLKDKNGKEIFEGDILKMSWSEWSTRGYLQSSDMTNEYEEIVTVKFKAPNFCFFLKNGKQTNLRSSATIEVIGNIFETPEKLEQDGQ
jgi:uncharacterized phage protein (TIGR01671 family)